LIVSRVLFGCAAEGVTGGPFYPGCGQSCCCYRPFGPGPDVASPFISARPLYCI